MKDSPRSQAGRTGQSLPDVAVDTSWRSVLWGPRDAVAGERPQSSPANLIVGIDPGLAGTGFALLAEPNRVVACGTVSTIPGREGPRLVAIANHLRALIAEHHPSEASLEELFMGRNATSAIGVAQARGAILAVLEECHVPVFEYKPSQVKIVLTGYGKADKSQIERMLAAQVLLPAGKLDEHARDAIAIAVCHARSRKFNGSRPR